MITREICRVYIEILRWGDCPVLLGAPAQAAACPGDTDQPGGSLPAGNCTIPTICRKHSRGRLKKVAFGRDPHTQTANTLCKSASSLFSLSLSQCHGDCDPVVPYRWGQLTSTLLKAFLPNHQFKTYKVYSKYIQDIFKVYSR